jgi:hypothetical protein
MSIDGAWQDEHGNMILDTDEEIMKAPVSIGVMRWLAILLFAFDIPAFYYGWSTTYEHLMMSHADSSYLVPWQTLYAANLYWIGAATLGVILLELAKMVEKGHRVEILKELYNEK